MNPLNSIRIRLDDCHEEKKKKIIVRNGQIK